VKTEGRLAPGGIEIVIDESDRPFCSPYYSHAHPGDEVKWRFDGPWAIDFGEHSPLEGGATVVRGFGDRPAVRIAREARGHYRYSIFAVGQSERNFGTPTPTIFYDLGCPEIIIDLMA
jgi:hypothetical protein